MFTTAARLHGAQWRRSHYSGVQGNCVELAPVGPVASPRVAVRNSRFPAEPALLLSPTELATLLGEVKAGRFDDLLLSA
jgi:hypothetical protein